MPLNLTKGQLILGGIVALVVVVLGLVLSGVIPGLRGGGPEEVTGALKLWNVGDSEAAVKTALDAFKAKYPKVAVGYRTFSEYTEYERALLDALAAGTGPDVFVIRNTDLRKHMNKLAPAPAATFPLTSLHTLFPQVVEQDFVTKGTVYALPLSIDTLALYANRDLLDRGGVAEIPKTWEEVKAAVAKLARTDGKGNLTEAAVPLGATLQRNPRATDLLALLMLQTGTPMTNAAGTEAQFATEEGVNALNFYREFADPKGTAYGWSNALGSAPELFATGRLAMTFEYAAARADLRARNAFLNFATAPIPQPREAKRTVGYPAYLGFAVSRQSRSPALAWDLVTTLTTSPANAKAYLETARKPPALRALVQSFENDPELGVFARQILTARSWLQVDAGSVSRALGRAIERVLADPRAGMNALREAEEEISALMARQAP